MLSSIEPWKLAMEKKQMDSLMSALAELRDLDMDMPIAQALSLLLIAKHEGLSLSDLAKKAGVGMASASRYVAAFGKPTKPGAKGFGLAVAVEDPMERRKKIINLTPKGRAFVAKLLGG